MRRARGDISQCGLLISIASTNARTARAYFAAGQARDAATVWRLEGELRQIGAALFRAVGVGSYIDGAYDKVLWRLHDPAFPLRLLPPIAPPGTRRPTSSPTICASTCHTGHRRSAAGRADGTMGRLAAREEDHSR